MAAGMARIPCFRRLGRELHSVDVRRDFTDPKSRKRILPEVGRRGSSRPKAQSGPSVPKAVRFDVTHGLSMRETRFDRWGSTKSPVIPSVSSGLFGRSTAQFQALRGFHPSSDLLAVHADTTRRLDPHANSPAFHFNDGHSDIVADQDGFVAFALQDKHGVGLLSQVHSQSARPQGISRILQMVCSTQCAKPTNRTADNSAIPCRNSAYTLFASNRPFLDFPSGKRFRSISAYQPVRNRTVCRFKRISEIYEEKRKGFV